MVVTAELYASLVQVVQAASRSRAMTDDAIDVECRIFGVHVEGVAKYYLPTTRSSL